MNKTHLMEEFHNFPWDQLEIAINNAGCVPPGPSPEGEPVRYWLRTFSEKPCIEIGYRTHNEIWVIPSALTHILREMHKKGAQLQKDQILNVLGVVKCVTA